MLQSSTNKLERRREGQCVPVFISPCRQLVYSVRTWDTLLKREILGGGEVTNMSRSKFLVDLS